MSDVATTRIPDEDLTQEQIRLFGAVMVGEGTQVPFVTSEGNPLAGTLAVLVSPTSLWAYASNTGGDDGTYYLVAWDGEKWAEARL